jgi:hypothetical protein
MLLDAGLKAKAKYTTLDAAVETIEPWDPEMIFVDHPFKSQFALRAIEREEASEYLCDQTKFAGDPRLMAISLSSISFSNWERRAAADWNCCGSRKTANGRLSPTTFLSRNWLRRLSQP